MPDAEHMTNPLKYIPPDIIQGYLLTQKVHSSHIYCKINKGMYGLNQAALLTYTNLKHNLGPYGYHPTKHSTGLWHRTIRLIIFCPCVDDFGFNILQKMV